MRSFANSTKCPHCGTDCFSLRTDQITPTYREVVYKCRNDSCEHIFVAALTPVRTVIPSRIPDPSIIIPIAG